MHPRLSELVAYLDEQHADLRQVASTIPPERQTVVPPGGGWSIAQVMEHLVILEARITRAFRAWLAEAKAKGLPREDDDSPILPSINTAAVINRSRRVVTPPQGEPTGTMGVDEAIRRLDEIRSDMKVAIAEGDGYALDQIVQTHPALGPLNMYQWIGATAAHMRRHADQIREIDASLRATAE